jgi:hypothetical protein
VQPHETDSDSRVVGHRAVSLFDGTKTVLPPIDIAVDRNRSVALSAG